MKPGQTNHDTIMDITLCLNNWKSSGKIPSTFRGLMALLRKEIKSSFTERAVRNCCDRQGIEFKKARTKSVIDDSYMRGKQAKSVARTLRQIIHNIESTTGMLPGTLMANGVHEALRDIVAGKNVDSSCFDHDLISQADDGVLDPRGGRAPQFVKGSVVGNGRKQSD